jgi:hypothetical protein
MRVPAKALPCLLFCLACVTLAPATAALAAPLPKNPPVPHAVAHAVGHHAHAAAHRRSKAPAAPKLVQAAPHDSSNRFLMTQGGHQMSADDFDAWMKARGIRVAKGAPEAPKATD